jgi:hypothetical protein
MPPVPRESFGGAPQDRRCRLHKLPPRAYTEDVKPFMAVVGEYLSLAFLLPVATFVGYLIGYLLDKAFGTNFLYIPFLILGIAAGFVQLIRQVMRDSRDHGG